MSKKSRAAKKAQARVEEIERNGRPRPLPPPPPAPKPSCLPPTERALFLTEEHAKKLLWLMEAFDPNNPLLVKVKVMLLDFNDAARKLKDLEVIARANGFWETEKGQPAGRVMDKLKKQGKGKVEQYAREAARELCPSVEEVKEAISGPQA